MNAVWDAFRELPLLARHTLATGIVCGAIGGLTGLVVGLEVNPGTAWFAVIELGLPSFVSGCFLGFLGSLIWQWVRRRPESVRRHGRLLP